MEGKDKTVITYGGSLMHAAGTAVITDPETGKPVDREPDFSGWATKFGIKCADGRTITKEAFAHQDGIKVPLVWSHEHDEPTNVLGHMILENRDEGVYAHGFFNETNSGKHAKVMVEHGDVDSLSIYANKLKERGKEVLHGIIREVSLVLARANPGALIDNVALAHGEDLVVLDDEAVIYSDAKLEHSDTSDSSTEDGPTVQQVWDGMNDDQKAVAHYMVEQAMETKNTDPVAAAHSALPAKTDPTQTKKEGLQHMSRNAFEQNRKQGTGSGDEGVTLSHDDIKGIEKDAIQLGSLKKAVEAYALAHGIEDIDILFPDAKTIDATPDFDKRRTEWVSSVITNTRHVPFSRIKSVFADITDDAARAKGYIKGTFKREEWFGLAKRQTTPTTIYKKQQLDRDDIIDITSFDVVIWLKSEMRLMLDEELARAILIGDGRDLADPDKIRDPAAASDGAGIRSIYHDHDLYAARIRVPWDEDDKNIGVAIAEEIMLQMGLYKGSGSPVLYTTLPVLNRVLLAKDGMQRRLWRTKADFAAEIGVSDIVTVEVMEDEAYSDLIGIIVNLTDYAVGTDRGGEITMFDDFDIDYNTYKYLIETRAAGALTKIRSALIVLKVASNAVLIVPEEPTFDGEDVLIPTNANVDYTNADTGAALADGATIAVPAGTTLRVHAAPTAGHYFETDQSDDWAFTNPA